MSAARQPRVITLPGQQLRHWAKLLLDLHLRLSPPLTSRARTQSSIRIVCISDTHNNKPDLPPGDVLIHAGDLTENGSCDELQAQLEWLSAQPYYAVIAIAGNHDVLLDEKFLQKYPERRYGDTRTRVDLDWGRVVYLQDEGITVTFPDQKQQRQYPREGPDELETRPQANAEVSNNDSHQALRDCLPQDQSQSPKNPRTLKVYGSPVTPQYGISAFQYPSSSADEVWSNRIPDDTDIVVVHGPPRLHLDSTDPNGLRRSGCAHLNQEIHRIRPRLVVFGHIHVGYGREDIALDDVRQRYEMVMNRLGGWGVIMGMAWAVMLDYLKRLLRAQPGEQRVTTFVNAAVVGGGLKNELRNEAIVVDI
ncbi:Metallo-dependent phosphatase-like protein [Aspergillus multicolor]|uniref:metallophosphatase domain-containing protein n=1 Tax=Aspergillus multicolor TaxID=41759 RepID=UPI003CCD5FAC